MDHFWYISGNIPKGLGFTHFDGFHLAWLTGAVLFIVLCSLIYCRLDEKKRKVQRRAVALGLLAAELFKDIPLLVMGDFTPSYLPFELCSINLFLIVWHAWKPNQTLSAFLYTVCIPGAMAAMLFPSWTKLPGLNFMCIHSFALHILLILYPVMLLAAGEIRPRLRQVPKCMGLLACLAAFALVMNLLLECNFMFLMYANKNNPLYWFEKNWGNHLWGFPVLITAIVAVMYAPIELARKLKK